jgi:putative spermidine/putrescine transport system substrate-binding protein
MNNDRHGELDRRQFLKVSAGAVGAGVASMLVPGVMRNAFAASSPLDKALMAAARKEGRLNVIALPPDWANYGKMIKAFERVSGLRVHNASPDASSAQELQAVRSLKGQRRGPDAVDVGPSFALAGVSEGLFQPYKVSTWDSIPDNMKELPPAEPYKYVQFPNNKQAQKAQDLLKAEWTKAVKV